MQQITLISGASRGIGAATATVLAQQGHWLCLNYVSDRASAEAVQAQVQNLGAKAIVVQADVSQEAEVEALFEQTDQELGRITGLVNNAAILRPQCRLENMDAQRINQVLTTNVTSCFLCCREAIKRMSNKQGGQGGAIVNVSSAASRLGAAGEYIDYAASKGAMDSLTRGLAVEVAPEGIRVNAVRPGFIYTDMHRDGGEPGRVDRVAASLPMGRGGQAEEVANAIAWLLSPQASYTTGSFVEVAGGR